MKVPCVVIGGGLSGLAAAIRLARFIPDVLLLEQHTRLGGLNSYYFRNKTLFETGLHAITNYAHPKDKRAPLNRLLRQLKISRKTLSFHEQKQSEIVFGGQAGLRFSNDFSILTEDVSSVFPGSIDGFMRLCAFLENFDPFEPAQFRSTRAALAEFIEDRLLVDMLLCPLMYYGSSVENDMDLSQFAIMFQAIYKEGFFRPGGTIRDFLSILSDHLLSLGGTIRLGTRVARVLTTGTRVDGVELESGEVIESDYVLSTIGHQETRSVLGLQEMGREGTRLAFVESIFQLPSSSLGHIPQDKTVIFYSDSSPFSYQQPDDFADFRSGVICMPFNFQSLERADLIEVRSTHLASWRKWKEVRVDSECYLQTKKTVRNQSRAAIEKYIGRLPDSIVFEDTFTPVTIERYTAKRQGAIYGSPHKIKDGDLGYDNLFLAGTDQGFLGIVGSMLSGVSIANQHILPKF